jgi:hypothetical protein
MRADGSKRASAYYVRLAELLDCPCVRELPMGVSTEGFESLWLYTRTWTVQHVGQPLFIPKTAVVRKYVAYPLAHVGLRQVDLEKLKEFFEWADYAPGAIVAVERLCADFSRWLAEGVRLTRPGRAACTDERLDAVLQQVAQELKGWNGVAQDASGRKVAHVELTLDVIRGVPNLSYLARRPPGFPEVFEHDGHRFDSLEEGWYDPLPVPREDGAHLLHGFEWLSTQKSPSLVLRRAGARAIAFVKSEDYSGLTSRRRLLAGIECALLYHESAADTVRARVEQLVTFPPTLVRDHKLPEGWQVLVDVKLDRPAADTMPGLEALEVDAAVEIMTVGGLRIGRRAEWLVDRPPTLFVSGIQQQAVINRRPTRVNTNGVVDWEHFNREHGVYVIEAGRAQRRITLVEAAISQGLPVLAREADLNGFPLALARGHWIVLGRRPGQLIQVNLHTQDILRLSFEPVWAIRQATPGCALFVVSDERHPGDVEGDEPATAAWADTIQSAYGKGMPIASLEPATSEAAQRSWASFVRTARRLRRAHHEPASVGRSGPV